MTERFNNVNEYTGPVNKKKLYDLCDKNDNNIWKTIVKVGIAQGRKTQIPTDVKLEDGSIVTGIVLNRWEECLVNFLTQQWIIT